MGGAEPDEKRLLQTGFAILGEFKQALQNLAQNFETRITISALYQRVWPTNVGRTFQQFHHLH